MSSPFLKTKAINLFVISFSMKRPPPPGLSRWGGAKVFHSFSPAQAMRIRTFAPWSRAGSKIVKAGSTSSLFPITGLCPRMAFGQPPASQALEFATLIFPGVFISHCGIGPVAIDRLHRPPPLTAAAFIGQPASPGNCIGQVTVGAVPSGGHNTIPPARVRPPHERL